MDNLPAELIVNILNYLSDLEIVKLSSVNKLFLHCSRDKFLHSKRKEVKIECNYFSLNEIDKTLYEDLLVIWSVSKSIFSLIVGMPIPDSGETLQTIAIFDSEEKHPTIEDIKYELQLNPNYQNETIVIRNTERFIKRVNNLLRMNELNNITQDAILSYLKALAKWFGILTDYDITFHHIYQEKLAEELFNLFLDTNNEIYYDFNVIILLMMD